MQKTHRTFYNPLAEDLREAEEAQSKENMALTQRDFSSDRFRSTSAFEMHQKVKNLPDIILPRESVGERNHTKMSQRKTAHSFFSHTTPKPQQQIIYKESRPLCEEAPNQLYQIVILKKEEDLVQINVLKGDNLCQINIPVYTCKLLSLIFFRPRSSHYFQRIS